MTAAREPDACSAPYRVRFDEAGPDGLLRTSVLLRYAQDLAWYHSANRGFDRGWYASRGLTWLVRAAEVAVLAEVRVGDELVGTTRVVGWRRVWARRRTEFVDTTGRLVARVEIDWVLLDSRGAPTRIPPEFDAFFGGEEGGIKLARVDLEPSPATADTGRFVVRPQELDPMDHANNAVYADWLEERVLAAGGMTGQIAVRAIPRLARLEYARAAEAGSTVEASAWRDADDGGSWSCLLTEAASKIELLRARLEPGPG